MYPGHGMMGWGGYGYGIGVVGSLMLLALWGLIIVALVFLVRRLWDQSRPAEGSGSAEAPIEILKRRYARGEMIKEEFERIKQDVT